MGKFVILMVIVPAVPGNFGDKERGRMNIQETLTLLNSQASQALMGKLYGAGREEENKARYEAVVKDLKRHLEIGTFSFFLLQDERKLAEIIRTIITERFWQEALI